MNALKEMLALAEKPTSVALKSRDRQVLTIGQIADRGNQLIENMFGVEESAKTATKEFLVNLYPRLSLEPLKWHDDDGLPRLAAFTLNSPEFTIYVGYHYYGAMPRKMSEHGNAFPEEISNCYTNCCKLLKEKKRPTSRTTFSWTCHFSGFIPQKVKTQIVEAMKIFPKENIFIIAEPQNWSLEITIATTSVDPLVVAWDGESLRLIADFDTTGIEEAMIFESPDKKD